MFVTFSLSLCTSRAAPKALWWSDPVKPGEIVEVFGADLGRVRVEVEGREVPVDKTTETGLYFTFPRDAKKRVVAVKFMDADGHSDSFVLNNPNVKWLQGEEGGEAVYPGDKLRIFGRNLKIEGIKGSGDEGFKRPAVVAGRPPYRATVTLGGRELPLTFEDEWSLTALVPEDFPLGPAEVRVSNGESGLVPGGTIEVVRHQPFWKEAVFDVTAFGANGRDIEDDTVAVKAALAAAEKNGGGIVRFPSGRFQLREQIRIPEHTLLKGAGKDLTSVYWPDTDYPPNAYIVAKSNFGLEDIFFHTGYYDSFLAVDAAPEAFRRDLYYLAGTTCENITIRRCVFRLIVNQYHSMNAEMRSRRTAYREGRGWYIRNVRNCIIEDNDMEYTRPDMAFIVQGNGVRLSRNRFTGDGWTNFNGEKFIFEDNESANVGHSVGCIVSGMYVARNHLKTRWSGDREIITHDGRLCAFMGANGRWEGAPTKGRVRGIELEVFPDCPHPWYRGTNFWIGADVTVMSGPGLGQIRRIRDIAYPNRITLDRPFDVQPTDESRFAVTFQRKDLIYVDNTFEDATIGLQLYGGSFDGVVARNRTRRCGGLTAFGMTYYGYIPVWFTQFLDNVIEGGNQTRRPDPDGAHLLPKDAWLGTWSRPQDVARKLTRATVMRGNRLEGNARLISYSIDGIIENNVVRHSNGSIEYGNGRETVIERGNCFEDVSEEIPETVFWSYANGEFLVERGKPGDADYAKTIVRSQGDAVDVCALDGLKDGDFVTATARLRLKHPCLFGMTMWCRNAPARTEEISLRRIDDKRESVPVPRYGRVPRLWPAGDYELKLRRPISGGTPERQTFHYLFRSAGATNDVQDAIVPLPAPGK